MTGDEGSRLSRTQRLHRGLRWLFVIWAVVSTGWLVNSFRTKGVDAALLQSDERVAVRDDARLLTFLPAQPLAVPDAGENLPRTGLLFLCGGGVAAEAYAPLLRPIAERGHPVVIVRLPYRLAPLEGHKRAAVARALSVLESDDAERWVLAGHSLGGALATRVAARDPRGIAALVLIGTTHPKELDLSGVAFPVIKVYGTEDGVAPPERMRANRHLLSPNTRWVEIEGGNHAQFGHYGPQLFDGSASITRQRQQELTRDAMLEVLRDTAEPVTR